MSAFPLDGTFPTATAQYEKRNLAVEIPVWDEKICIQCLKCVAICPHATIRAKVYETGALDTAPAQFKSIDSRVPEFKGMKFTLQVAAEDCTGCALCVDVCPAKNKTEARLKAINMRPAGAAANAGARKLGFFPESARNWTGARSNRLNSASSNCSGHCSNSAARARDAAKRPISRCSRNSLVTVRSSPMPQAALRSMAAICQRLLTALINAAAARRGAIHFLKTTLSSALDFAFRSTNKKNLRPNLSKNWRRRLGMTSPARS